MKCPSLQSITSSGGKVRIAEALLSCHHGFGGLPIRMDIIPFVGDSGAIRRGAETGQCRGTLILETDLT